MYICKKCTTSISDRTASAKNNEWRGHRCPKCGAELEYINELQERAMKFKKHNMKKNK